MPRRSQSRSRVQDLPQGRIPTSHATVELTTDNADPYGVMLWIDGAESSYLDLAEPSRLEFEYMQQMMLVLRHARTEAQLRAVHLGGAGCAMPRAIAHEWPQARQIAVEWDEVLAQRVREWFDLPRSPQLRIRVADARTAVEGFPAGSKDLVLRDVFTGRQVPEHVRTVEFTQEVARALAPQGLYLLNTADRPPLSNARREAATVAGVFDHVLVIAEPAVLKGRRFGNVVIAAAHGRLPVTELLPALRALPVPANVLGREKVRSFIGTYPPFRDPQAQSGSA